MITTLWWIAVIAGGILVLLLLLSIIGGIELDVDVPSGDMDVNSDAGGGLGILKGLLTIVSVGSWTAKIALLRYESPWIVLMIGLFVGLVACLLLHYMLKHLTKNENVNTTIDQAYGQSGVAYLPLSSNVANKGQVTVNIKGSTREYAAISNGDHIPTGTPILVVEVMEEENYLVVQAKK